MCTKSWFPGALLSLRISLWQCGQRLKLNLALNCCLSTIMRLLHLHLLWTHHTQNPVNLEQAGLHHTASDVCDYQPSSCSRCLLSGVLIRIVRLVSFGPPEAELGSCDPPVHIFNVFTLSLKVVCGVIRAGHKYLGRKQEKAEDNKTKLFVFFPSENVITWLLFPSSLGTSRCRTDTNLELRWNDVHEMLFQNITRSFWIWNVTDFCMMGSRSSSAGCTSLSGLPVSAVVLTVAM